MRLHLTNLPRCGQIGSDLQISIFMSIRLLAWGMRDIWCHSDGSYTRVKSMLMLTWYPSITRYVSEPVNLLTALILATGDEDVHLIEDCLVWMPIKELDLNYIKLTHLGYHTNFPGWLGTILMHLTWPSDDTVGSSLNPDRTAARGKPLFSLHVMPWADDASGNRSKQYNPHINLCMQNPNLSHEKLKHQYFIHFCSTSQHASSGEQFQLIIEEWYSAFLYRCHAMLRQFAVAAISS